MTKKQLLLASPRGFCAGVERALLIVEELLKHFSCTIYVRHEIVHNRYVVDNLIKRGVIFVDSLNNVPDGAIVVFSAHGVSKEVEDQAKARKLRYFDSTCPLVFKVHLEVCKIAEKGDDCILIGHSKHPEVIGTMGRFDSSNGGTIYLVENSEQARQIQVNHPLRLHLVTQTTLSVDDTAEIRTIVKERFPAIKATYKDICYATQNRQNAVKELNDKIDVLIVVGSANSSNSTRLQEIAQQLGTDSYLVDNEQLIQSQWLEGKNSVGLTAGASVPDSLVEKIINKLELLGCTTPQILNEKHEKVFFPLPKSVQKLSIH